MLRFRAAALAAIAFGATASVCGQDLKVEKYQLPNGMTVILHQDKSLPIATINTWFRVGSKDEPDRRSGFAHLFEHLMFMGTKRVPNGQFDQIMEKLGGSNNATTSQDRTNYFSSGPSSILKTLLWLDADRLEALADSMDLKKLDLQRDVVKNERRQSVEQAPYGKAYNEIGRLMYPAGHPYSWSVIGSHEDLSAATVTDVQDFFRTYYVPNNASLVVAGDFEPSDVKPLINEYFGTLPRGNDAPRRSVPVPVLNEVKRHTMVDKVEQTKVIMVWHSPAAYKPGDAEMKLAAGILADGVSSRLYQKLVSEDRIATEVSAYQDSSYLGSLFYVEANVSDTGTVERVESAIDAVLRNFQQSGPSDNELKQEKAKFEKNLVDSLQSIDRKADKLNEFEFYLGDPSSFQTVLNRYRQIDPIAVKDQLATTIDLNRRLILRVLPQSDPPRSNPRDNAPIAPPTAPFSPKGPTEITLNNGIKVFYWRREELPLMNVVTVFKGGTADDVPTMSGLTALTAEMLTQGTTTKSAAEFNANLQLLGISISANASAQNVSVGLSSISANFERSLALYADALANPAFAPSDWDRVKRIEIANLEQQKSNPTAIAFRTATNQYFGDEHPLGMLSTEDTVRRISASDLRLRHGAIFQPQNAVIFAAGNIPSAAIKFELEKAFRRWNGSGRTMSVKEIPPVSKKPLRVLLVDRPGSVQSVIRMLMPGPAFNSPERVPFEALGTILGGSFTSRLNQNLREDKGYTYGANSRFTFLPSLGYLSAGASVRTDVTGASLKEFVFEFNKIRTEGISADEAAKASSILQTNVIESLATMEGLLQVAQRLNENGKAFGTLGEDLTAMRSLNKSVLDSLAKDAIAFDDALIVIVGDKQAILPQLAGLGLPTPLEVVAK